MHVLVQVKADGVSVDLALYRAGAADGVGPNDAAVRWICVRRRQKAAFRQAGGCRRLLADRA